MAASLTTSPLVTSSAALRVLLATEPDAHRRQRELVRASLYRCPGKGRAATRAHRIVRS
jgi:hypothetical protein